MCVCVSVCIERAGGRREREHVHIEHTHVVECWFSLLWVLRIELGCQAYVAHLPVELYWSLLFVFKFFLFMFLFFGFSR